ncbi:MAG: thioesterase [Promethearchaeota archaeon]|nr:MAG: thioesterase [Candidatus Lokiarchaeota archaeon]
MIGRMIEQNTHLKINKTLSGEIIKLDNNYSKVRLVTNSDMVVDERGLIHGGFIFNLADFASMVAVNHPNVVLGGANVKFFKPVQNGDILVAEANLTSIEGKKNLVNVKVSKDNDVVFKGDFVCFITETHVLDGVDKA